MLLELSVVEQRYDAVMEVLRDGLSKTEVADRYGGYRARVCTPGSPATSRAAWQLSRIGRID